MAAGTITRFAGTGVGGNTGDDGPATNAQFLFPDALAVAADGGVLIADAAASVVRKVSPAGTITRVAGTGIGGNSGDDAAAIDAQLNNPTGLAVTGGGDILIADEGNHVIRSISADGTITRVAGTGVAGNTGDDGPAIDAQLDGPIALAITADGGVLIADHNSHVVRKVSATGTITRLAGTGIAGNTGDDGPAIDAQLNNPIALAITADGGVLIADYNSHVVRKVSATGTITRLAGTGIAGNTGDDGPAIDAQLDGPIALAVTADGGVLIADWAAAPVVRKVSADGTITRVAGTGVPGNSGDDGPATAALLQGPRALATTADGFLIADGPARVVRKVSTQPG